MTVAGRERRWVLVFGVAVVLITTVPYLLAYQSAGQAWRFSGFLIGVEDGNSYLAKMLRGSYGAWLFRTPYSLLAQPGVLVFVPYLLLGKLAAGPGLHEQLVALFHLFRAAGVIVAAYGTYAFARRYLPSPGQRRWATAVAMVGGGIGWLLPLLGKQSAGLPLEYISPETFGFLAALAVPHLAMARGLLLLALVQYLRALDGDRLGPTGPLLWLASFLVNPLTGLVGGLLLGAHQLVRLVASLRVRRLDRWWRGTRAAGWMGVLSLPYGLYLLWAYQRDPFLRGWALQNQILSPPVLYYLLAYGLLLPPAIIGGNRLLRGEPARDGFPVLWVLLLPALAYTPVGIQRRLVEGGWVALSVLAALGLGQMGATRRQRWATAGLLGLTLPASLLLMAGSLQLARSPAPPVFLPLDQVKAFQSLRQQTRVGEVAIGAYATANALPAWAPVTVPIGHGPESIQLGLRQGQIRAFYGTASSAERRRLAAELGADWVLLGPAERALASSLPIDRAPAQLVGTWGPYRLFRWFRSP